ncbi:AI-2E family transporter [Cellulomonas biazotea]|uniref:AI-2E family transporter n=1 Tax=Cellulomonas biazotea TaxID=1709 RepID=A0A402DNZ5_9CELL|nr:AI-2E family transporter [Cellulomonas biazotea]GCE75853.1 AI-2E family transporter [Cellulomonas biazotea]
MTASPEASPAPAPVSEAAPADAGRTTGDAVPSAVRAAASWSWRLLLIGAALAVLLWLIAQLKVVVVPVAIALLLTVLLTPLVGWMHHRLRLPRGAAAGIAVVLLVGVVGTLLTLAGRSVVKGIGALWDQASEGVDKILDWLATGPLQLSTDDLQGWIDRIQESASGAGSSVVSGVLTGATTVGHVLAGAIIALFCTFFFLLDGRTIWAWVVGLLPRGSREHVHQAARRGVVTLGAYTRTQILVAAVDAVGIGVGAAILGVPLALPLAILVFLGSFVPIVGAVVTGSIAVLVALVAQGPGAAIIMLAIVLGVQQLEGHVLQPFLMGHAVSLHPVAVLLSVAAGSLIAGILGALFAVPIVAVLNTVVLYLHGHDKFPQLGTNDHVPVRGRGHPVLDRAIAQVAERESEAAATQATADELGSDPATGKDEGATVQGAGDSPGTAGGTGSESRSDDDSTAR